MLNHARPSADARNTITTHSDTTTCDVQKSVDAAFEAMKHPTGDSTTASHVHTLIVPHDFTWAPSPPENAARMRQVDAHPAGAQQEESCLPGVGHRALRTQRGDGTGTGDHTLPVTGGQADFIDACARAMQDAPGKLCIMVGGSALEVDGDDAPLILAGKIAAAVNAELFCEPFPARLDRGVGLPRLKRMPYFPEVCCGIESHGLTLHELSRGSRGLRVVCLVLEMPMPAPDSWGCASAAARRLRGRHSRVSRWWCWWTRGGQWPCSGTPAASP